MLTITHQISAGPRARRGLDLLTSFIMDPPDASYRILVGIRSLAVRS